MEKTDFGVHQGNTQLIAGVDDHLICSRARGGSNILHTALKAHTNRKPLNHSHFYAPFICHLKKHKECIIQWGKKYLIPCWFCTFAHWQRNDQSIILMVGLFEQWETEQKNPKKPHFKKSYKLIWILMSEISIWTLRKTWLNTWWQNPCWQSQRSEVSCSWPPGLHTSQEGFCPTPLCRSSPSH